MTATKTTTIILTPTTRRQLAEIGGQQSETIRRAVAVLWTLEVEAPRKMMESRPEERRVWRIGKKPPAEAGGEEGGV